MLETVHSNVSDVLELVQRVVLVHVRLVVLPVVHLDVQAVVVVHVVLVVPMIVVKRALPLVLMIVV